ncbi:MAG TPA: ribbon-helix-helix domain-containing protein [Acidimicrobiia bacterium]|nr:ribbon-helix-helix domain-containing protein [Acidimicrobiia bacterium]
MTSYAQRNADRYAERMAQFVTRIDDEFAEAVDELVDAGIVESRSAAVREGLEWLVDHHRRRRIGEAIVAGYTRMPQTDEEVGWSDAATARMIAEEPW